MVHDATLRVIVTGAPGTGKTTTLESLQTQGYSVAPDAARAVIAERKARGLPPRPAPFEFAKTILERDINQYDCSAAESQIVFFDRSVVDALGMLFATGKLSEAEQSRLLETYPYHPPAFIFPPWPEIYRMDSERDQTYEEAVAVHESVVRWYGRCGYPLITVPPGAVEERCEFLLQQLAPRDVR